uniref:Uncharacterized protein n=1 Tax=Anguilla anguilla TaxID=7936 RepID=A0A0E9TQH1_ANGAN
MCLVLCGFYIRHWSRHLYEKGFHVWMKIIYKLKVLLREIHWMYFKRASNEC